MDVEEVRELLRERVKELGTQKALAERGLVSPCAIAKFLSGDMEKPQPKILQALGLQKKVSYEPIK